MTTIAASRTSLSAELREHAQRFLEIEEDHRHPRLPLGHFHGVARASAARCTSWPSDWTRVGDEDHTLWALWLRAGRCRAIQSIRFPATE
jgi:hypothetical protein